MPADLPRPIRLLITDVDGILTDGSVIYSEAGVEWKRFNVRDGAGVKYLQRAGIEVAIVTGRQSRATLVRARDLAITEVHQGRLDKRAVLDDLKSRYDLATEEIAYLGDDLTDLGVYDHVGLFGTSQDAAPDVRALAHWVAAVPGGQGVLREFAEFILKRQGHWQAIVDRYRHPQQSEGPMPGSI